MSKFYLFFLVSLSFLILPGSLRAQNEGNTWYFGEGAGINFNTSPPTPLTDGKTNSREGVATISDKTTGKLLFYTEGTTIWDATHQVMPNGYGLQGDYTSTQSAIIVPEPGNANKYYIFTTAEFKGFRYSEVDMTLNAGRGDVISATKNTSLIPDDVSTEKVIATRNCDGKDYWVITHTKDNNTFYVFLITAAGISPPLTFNVGSVIHSGGGEVTSYLKVSPDGSILANAFGNPLGSSVSKVEILHFNNQTGMVSGPVTTLDGLNNPYGVEFSPNGTVLYVSTQNSGNIFQYNLLAPDINASRVTIFTSGSLRYGALQLGPDNRIYVAAENGYNIGYGYLGLISQPDVLGSGCNYKDGAFYLNGKNSLIGLPTLMGSFFYTPARFTVKGTCLGSETTFTIDNTNNIKSVKWDFGDGTGSTDLRPVHKYSIAKSYIVQLTVNLLCNSEMTTQTITVHPVYNQTENRSVCQGENYTLPDGRSTGTQGVYISSLKTLYGCDSIITTNLTVNPSYNLTVTDSICSGENYTLPDGSTVNKVGTYVSNLHAVTGCDSIITTRLFIRTAYLISRNDTICEGQSYTLPGGQVVNQAGTYSVSLRSVNGCDSVITTNIFVKPPPVVNLGRDTCIIAGNTFLLHAGSGYLHYIWQDGSNAATYQVNAAGSYWVKVTDECGAATGSIKVTTDCSPDIFIPSAFTPNNDGTNDVFRILNGQGQQLLAFSIFNRWGAEVFHTTDIANGWNGEYKGVLQEMGTYIYVIKIIDLKGRQKTYRGTVLLIR